MDFGSSCIVSHDLRVGEASSQEATLAFTRGDLLHVGTSIVRVGGKIECRGMAMFLRHAERKASDARETSLCHFSWEGQNRRS